MDDRQAESKAPAARRMLGNNTNLRHKKKFTTRFSNLSQSPSPPCSNPHNMTCLYTGAPSHLRQFRDSHSSYLVIIPMKQNVHRTTGNGYPRTHTLSLLPQ